jgi:prevent-host-death family protein
MNEWQLQKAKAKFSEVVKLAMDGETQLITKRGKKVVVVLSYSAYLKLNRKSMTLLDVFSGAPRLDENDLPLRRDKTH